MSSSISSNPESIVPRNQYFESGVSYRSTGSGKRVRVMNSEDSKKLFSNFLTTLPEVTAFVSEKEYSRLPIVSREFKKQVSSVRAVNIRSNEVWGCESSVRLSPQNYAQLLEHKKDIRDIVLDRLSDLTIPEALAFIKEQEKYNSTEAADTLKSYFDTIGGIAIYQQRDKIEAVSVAERLGLRDESKQLLNSVQRIINRNVITLSWRGVDLEEEINAILGQEKTDPIKKIHMCLDCIERKQSLLSDWNKDLNKLSKCIDILIKRWKRAPEIADEDIIEIRKTFAEADNSKKINSELIIMIASASAKIETGNAHDDVKKACEIIKGIEDPFCKFEFLRIMVIKGLILNPEEAINAFMTAYESSESVEKQSSLVQDLREIDLKMTSIIPDLKFAGDIQNLFHISLIFAWVAKGHAAVNLGKAMPLFNDVVQNYVDQLEPKDKEKVGIALAEALLEMDPLKVENGDPLKVAHNLVVNTSLDDYNSLNDKDSGLFKLEKTKIFLKIARAMVKQAKTKEDLNEGARIFAQAQDILENEISKKEISSADNSSNYFLLLMDLLRFSIPVFDAQ